MLNFSGAPVQTDWSELIPNGTLARGLLRVRWFNADAGLIETVSKTAPKPGARTAKYLDCVIKILDGQHAGREIYTRIGTDGSEKYVDMGRASIRAILEYGRGAGPTNLQAYSLQGYDELDNHGEGIQVGIKIKLEPAKGDYGEKNDVSVFLSPVADSGTTKDFARLMAGDTAPTGPAAKTASAAPAKHAWQQAAVPQAPAQAVPVANPTQAPNTAPAQTAPAQTGAPADQAPTNVATPASMVPPSPTTTSPSNAAPSWLVS
jgi:hypothetical protein